MAKKNDVEMLLLPKCTHKNIGLTVSPKTPEAEAEAVELIEDIDNYLSDFCVPNTCPKCGSKLGGIMGSFVWGLCHGEGLCRGGLFVDGGCSWPVRAYHLIPDRDGKQIFKETVQLLLPYHPSVVLEPRAVTVSDDQQNNSGD